MPWMISESDLDANQRDFLRKFDQNGRQNYWVKGFAGSGKSVLVVHAFLRAVKDNPQLDACFVLYTHSLIDLIKTGIPEEYAGVPVMTYYQFRKSSRSYDLILVDEVQDLPEKDLASLKRRSGRLIVAGDEAQSIYDDRVAAEEIPDLTASEPFALEIIHRLTNKIIEVAKRIFPSKKLEQARKSRAITVDVTLAHSEKTADEVTYVWDQAKENALPGQPVAVLLPKRRQISAFANHVLRLEDQEEWTPTQNRWGKTDFGAMNRHLRSRDLPLRYIGNKDGRLREAESEGQVLLLTYHSSKGLDFETVFLPFLKSSTQIWGDEERAKTLFYVAVTRSRRNLYLSYTGSPHRFVKLIPERLVHTVDLPLPEPGDGGGLAADEPLF